MAIEVREEAKAERRFRVRFDIESRDSTMVFTEPELRELVEKGARALGKTVSESYSYYPPGTYVFGANKQENDRLRAWLKHIQRNAEAGAASYVAVPDIRACVRAALAGEEAPTT